MRRLLIILAFAGAATAAQAGDRFGGGGDAEASRAAYGAPPITPGELLTWKSKAPPAAGAQVDAYGRVRPEALSEWARRSDVQRNDGLNFPVQGAVVPQSKYTRGSVQAASIGQPTSALPSSIYDAPPTKAYAAPVRPKGAPVEIKADALPSQPTLSQQMANEEALSMAEAKAARARLLEAKNKGQGVLIDSQDAVQ